MILKPMKEVIIMSCCGQKRANLKNPASLATTPANAQPASNNQQRPPAVQSTPGGMPPVYASVQLRYLESSPVLVRGSVTGRQYEFSAARPTQLVDTRDAQALLRTRFFR